MFVVAVITATDLWDAMKPEVEMTVKAQLEPGSEEEDNEEEEEETRGEEERSDRDTAIQIAQFLRESKYRYMWIKAHSIICLFLYTDIQCV